jgi:hypothetical protein
MPSLDTKFIVSVDNYNIGTLPLRSVELVVL